MNSDFNQSKKVEIRSRFVILAKPGTTEDLSDSSTRSWRMASLAKAPPRSLFVTLHLCFLPDRASFKEKGERLGRTSIGVPGPVDSWIRLLAALCTNEPRALL